MSSRVQQKNEWPFDLAIAGSERHRKGQDYKLSYAVGIHNAIPELSERATIIQNPELSLGYCPHPVRVYIRGPIKGYI